METVKQAPIVASPGSIRPLIESWELSLRAANKSPKTCEVYREGVAQLAAFLEATGMPTDVEHVTREHVEAWILSLYDAGRSPATVSNRWRSTQQFFKWLLKEGEIVRNPMANMDAPKVPETMVPVLSPDELRALLKTTAGSSFEDRRDAAIIWLLIDSGLRRTEATNLKVDDVDRRAGTARVIRKGRREALVPIGTKALAAIDRYLRTRRHHPRAATTNALWLGHAGALTGSGLAQIVRKRGDQAGIEGLHPHQIRHTTAHEWLSHEGSESDLMQLMGWRSRAMLNRYGASAAQARARDAHRRNSLGDRL